MGGGRKLPRPVDVCSNLLERDTARTGPSGYGAPAIEVTRLHHLIVKKEIVKKPALAIRELEMYVTRETPSHVDERGQRDAILPAHVNPPTNSTLFFFCLLCAPSQIDC